MVNKRSPRKIFNQRGAVRMIYVTGDCHADFTKFNTKIFPEQYEMTKDDYVIICGDFGGVWNRFEENKHENHWIKENMVNCLDTLSTSIVKIQENL